MLSSLELLQFLVVRISHELAGTLSAVNQGVDILEKYSNVDLKQKSMNLIKISNESAIIRLQLIRSMYGVDKINDQADIRETAKLMQGFLKDSKIELIFDSNQYVNCNWITGKIEKLLLCIFTIAYYNTIYGGKIRVNFFEIENYFQMKVSIIDTKGLKINKEWNDILNGDVNVPEIDIINAHIFYTKFLLGKLKLIIQEEENSISYIVNIPR